MGENIYAAALLYNSSLFTRINKSTEEEEEEAAYRPLLRSFDSTCGGSHAHAYSSEVPKEHTRAAHLSYRHPLREDGAEVGEGKSQELRRLPGCLVAQWRQHMGEECVAGESLQSLSYPEAAR